MTGHAGRTAWMGDTVLLGALALAVRLPYLMQVPRFTDEVREINLALAILNGERLPLAAHNGYSGPLWNYLLAAIMRVAGTSPQLPRVTVMVIGTLTVVATYALARAMAGRAAGRIAGALMAVSVVPVLVSSHVAWSACTVPFWALCSLLAAHTAVERRSGPLVVLTGVLVAVTMQAHPLGVLLVPAILLWALTREAGRRLVGSPWTVAAAAAALLAYANMFAYHLNSRLETVRAAREKLADSVPAGVSWTGYLAALRALAANLVDQLAAQAHHAWFSPASPPTWFVLGAVLAILAVLALAARKGASLPLVVVVVTAALMPLFNSSYGFPLGARYLAFLVPVIYAGFGAAAAFAFEAAHGIPGRHSSWPRAAVAGLMVFLVAGHAAVHGARLRSEYSGAVRDGRTNADVLAATAAVADAWRDTGAPVLLSERIDAKYSGGGHLHRVLETLLGLRSVPFEKIDDELDGLEAQASRCRPRCIAVLAQHQRGALAADARLALVPWDTQPSTLPADGEAYGLYWLETR